MYISGPCLGCKHGSIDGILKDLWDTKALGLAELPGMPRSLEALVIDGVATAAQTHHPGCHEDGLSLLDVETGLQPTNRQANSFLCLSQASVVTYSVNCIHTRGNSTPPSVHPGFPRKHCRIVAYAEA